MISYVDVQLGSIILGLNWLLNAVSGLTVATPAVRILGFKYSMIVSLFGYAFQIGSLYVAVVVPEIAYPVAIVGSVIAGFTSAIWWTSQGVYFEWTCSNMDRLLTVTNDAKMSMIDIVRADLSAQWTIIYQAADIVVFLTLSVFPLALGISVNPVLFCLSILGMMTAFLGFTFESCQDEAASFSYSEVYEAALAVPLQFRDDVRASLLAPFVFGFGITTAMFAYYINSSTVTDSSDLGTISLGFLEAFSYLVAILSAYPYAYISNHYEGGQNAVIQFGSAAFLSCGLVVVSLTPQQIGTWQNMLILKGLYGLGRGVFEGSCRAVYASFFQGKDLMTAFSSQTLSAGFSGGVCFFLFVCLDRVSIASVTIVNGCVALAAYGYLTQGLDPYKPQSWSSAFGCCCRCCGYGGADAEARQQGSWNPYLIGAYDNEEGTSKSSLTESLLR